MKILWFTNTPCNAAKYLNLSVNYGGWLISLENILKLQKNVELNVAFLSQESIKNFRFESVNYYPIYNPSITKKNGIFKNLSILLSPVKNNNEKLISKCLEIVQKVNPDIIHIHGTENIFGMIQSHTQIPCIISIQGIINPYKYKFFEDIPKSIIIRYSNLLRIILGISIIQSFKKFKEIAIIEKQVLKDAQFVIGRTHWDKSVTEILAPKSKYFHLDEVLREEFYKSIWKKSNFNEKIELISIISRPPYKGLGTIVEVAKLLKENLNFTWKICGLKPNDEIVNIVKKWKKINYNELNIFFLGELKEKELINELLVSDIFIQTSRIENSSNSLCEAMILGMPIVASNVGGTSSLLRNNIDGFLVQEGEPFSIAQKIIYLSKNFKEASEMGKNARLSALNRHNKNKIIQNLIKLYKSILLQ